MNIRAISGIISGSQTINGLLGSVVLRDEAYQFLRIGRNLERGDMTTRIIDVRSTDLLPEEAAESKTFDTIQWVSVLNSLSAYQAYRRKVQAQVIRVIALKMNFTQILNMTSREFFLWPMPDREPMEVSFL